MTDNDDLAPYNNDPIHDGWVDFDNFENTGESDVCFAEQSDKLITRWSCLFGSGWENR